MNLSFASQIIGQHLVRARQRGTRQQGAHGNWAREATRHAATVLRGAWGIKARSHGRVLAVAMIALETDNRHAHVGFVSVYAKYTESEIRVGKWPQTTKPDDGVICGFCPLATPSAASQLISLDLFSSGQRNGFDLASS